MKGEYYNHIEQGRFVSDCIQLIMMGRDNLHKNYVRSIITWQLVKY